MNPEIATIERVRSVADQLRHSGEPVTADRVIAQLGGGSKGTVLKHLKKMREELDQESSLPASILELARPVLGEIYAAGDRAGTERQQAKFQIMDRNLLEMEAQIVELASEVDRLQSTNEMLTEERDAAARFGAQLEQRVETLVEGAKAPASATMDLAALVERLEASVSAVQTSTALRPTLSLKSGPGKGQPS